MRKIRFAEGKRGRKRILLAAVLALALGGCGYGADGTAGKEQGSEQEESISQPLLTHEEQVILDYYAGNNTENMTAEEYRTLAGLFEDRKKRTDERDVLEEGYQLLGDESLLEDLQQIWVNLEEEKDERVRSEGELMYQNISLPEFRPEAVNLLTDGQWLTVLMPKLYQGGRNYFLLQDGQLAMAIRVEYGELGCLEATVWYPEEDGGITVLRGNADKVTLLTTGLQDGMYDGAFEAWTCEAATGSVLHETGSFTRGNYSGAYTARLHLGMAESDIYSLWSHKEDFDFQEYKGAFDENGRTLIRQNDGSISLIGEESSGKYLVYAYNEELARGLYVSVNEEDPLTYVFTNREMGVKTYPTVETYQASGELEFLTDQEDSEQGGADPDESV